MELKMKNQLVLLTLAVIYILLATLGIYSSMGLFVFPILAVPWVLYGIKDEQPMKQLMMTQLMITLLMLFVGRSFLEPLVYLVTIIVPSFVFIYFYKRGSHLPQIIMYNGVAVTVAYFIYIVIVKQMGFDYVAEYLLILEEYKELYLMMIDDAIQNANLTISTEQIKGMKSLIATQIELLKIVYPSLFLLLNIALSSIYAVIVVIVGRILKREVPSIKTLGKFTFSKVLSGLLIISIILMPTDFNTDAIGLLMTNVFFFAVSLMQLLGFIVVMTWIYRTKWGRGIKTIAALAIVVIFPSISMILMSVAVLDTLFNFRKVDIII